MPENVFITGADKGLGFSLAKKFLAEGFQVFAGFYASPANLDAWAMFSPGTLVAIPQDVTSLESVRSSARQVAEQVDHLDILINNAGLFRENVDLFLPDLDLDDGHLQSMMEINAFGPLRVTQQFLSLLQQGQRKRIINISSESGSIGGCWRENTFAYSMSKSALNMQSMLLQRYLKTSGFKVLALHPGWMQTDMGGAAADLHPDQSAAAIYALAIKDWQPDDPIYMDYTGKPLAW